MLFPNSQLFTCMFLRMVHVKCRTSPYPFSEIRRLPVPDEKVPWSVNFENYNPPHYDSPVLKNKPWADPPIGTKTYNNRVFKLH